MVQSNLPAELYDLPIDQFSRQRWASLLIEQLQSGKAPVSILDVGGYKGKTAVFHPHDHVTVCDLFDVDEPNYVKGDGRKLPFKDNSFDFVVSFDTYEHVPRSGRKVFVSELCRVARTGVIVAAPFDTADEDVLNAEKSLNQYYKDFYDKEHPWLKEHIDYKTPKQSEIEHLLNNAGATYTSFASNDLGLWELVQAIYFSIDIDEDLRGRVDDINRYYNHHLTDVDLPAGLSYRRIYFISDSQDSIDTVCSYIDSVGIMHDATKASFIAYALSIFGKKYRDVVRHRDYLDKELLETRAILKRETESMAAEIHRLNVELGRPLKQRVIQKLRHRKKAS